MKLSVSPKQEIDRSEEIKQVDTEMVKQELQKLEEFQSEFRKIEPQLRQLEAELKSEKTSSSDPEVLFLGTGAALPSKYRNGTTSETNSLIL